MTLLIDKTYVATKLQVAIGYSDKDFETYVREAQMFDLRPLIREDFFADVMAGVAEPQFVLLLDGGDYDYNNRNYQFEGIKTILAYYAYARFVMSSSAVSTSFGMVVKTNPNSQPLNLEERKNFYYKKKAEAGMLFDDLKRFVERRILDYPTWFDRQRCEPTQQGNFNTTVIQ